MNSTLKTWLRIDPLAFTLAQGYRNKNNAPVQTMTLQQVASALQEGTVYVEPGVSEETITAFLERIGVEPDATNLVYPTIKAGFGPNDRMIIGDTGTKFHLFDMSAVR